jgi:hypothetical protein
MKPVRVAIVGLAALLGAIGGGLWFVADRLRTIGEKERARQVLSELASDDIDVRKMAMAKARSDRVPFGAVLPGLVELSSDPRPEIRTTVAQLTYLMAIEERHVPELRAAVLAQFVANATAANASEPERIWALQAVMAVHVKDPADVRALAALAEEPALTPDVRDLVIHALHESRSDEAPMIAEVVDDLRRRRTPAGGITESK